jgi:YggT family protein
VIAQTLDQLIRYFVLAAFGAASVVALTHWLVREGKLQPFGTFARGVRRLSDPALKPIEGTLARRGRNPQEGPFWLLMLVVAAGIVLISTVRWLIEFFISLRAANGSGPAGVLRFVLDFGFNLLMFAIVIRVAAGWIGAGRQTRWSRPFFVATDWLVEPIRRRLPPLAMIDLSPLAAYLVVLIGRSLIMGALR